MSASLAERAVRKLGLDGLRRHMSPEQLEAMRWDWRCWARPEQLEPAGDWATWLVLAGRGFGKTRVGAEWTRKKIERGIYGRMALVASTAGDVRDVMVEGESGILQTARPSFRPIYEPSKRRLTWPNGAQATCYSADEPDRLRGPQHDGAWADEIAAWRYPETWDMLQFGLRLGTDPRTCATSTPKPIALVRELLRTAAVTRGSTYDNRRNLAPKFLAEMQAKYEGTRLGRQELYAEVLDDVPGALWQRAQLDALRVREAPELARIVVAVDPAASNTERSDETGIVVVGKGVDGHAYVLADRSCRMSPDGWGRRAVEAYHEFKADRIVAEVNNGGDMVGHVVHVVDEHVAYLPVHASRGKVTRAEPVAALYEQGRAHHVGGGFAALEDQQCCYTPEGFDGSPDRVDALVWGMTELMLGEPTVTYERKHRAERRI